MLDEFIIPIMSEEGITELLSVLREEVITGEKSSDYLSHSVSMGFERRPPMNGSDGLDDNFKRMQHINMLHSFAKFGDFNHANVPFVFNSGMLEEYNRIKSSKFDL